MKIRTQLFLSFIILLIAGSVAFYFGWSQIKVKPDSCGVLVSKTGGVCTKPITSGVFTWNWELLIPTNAEVRTFEITPYEVTRVVNNSLPSADLYSKQIKENPDFSYMFNFEINLSYTPEQIVEFVKTENIKNDSDLKQKLNSEADKIASSLITIIFDKLNVVGENTFQDIQSIVNSYIGTYSGKTNVTSIIVKNSRIPDVKAYRLAKESFERFQTAVDIRLSEQAAIRAAELADYDANIKKLEKLGALLKEYPELSDIIKSKENLNAALDASKIK